MSYQIVKSLKIENNKIYCLNRSNNVFPADWNTYELDLTEDNLRDIYKWLCGKVWQPMCCCSWWYSLMDKSFMNSTGYYIDSEQKPRYYDTLDKPFYGEWNPQKIQQNYKLFRSEVRAKFGV